MPRNAAIHGAVFRRFDAFSNWRLRAPLSRFRRLLTDHAVAVVRTMIDGLSAMAYRRQLHVWARRRQQR